MSAIPPAPSDPCTMDNSWFPSSLTTAAPAPSPNNTHVDLSFQFVILDNTSAPIINALLKLSLHFNNDDAV